MFSLFVLMMNSSANAFIISWLNDYVGEVEAGGATNRIQTFFFQYVFIANAFIPLYSIFPIVPLALTLFYVTSVALLAALNAIAELCHKNQIARNAEQLDHITSFPFDLHDSELFVNTVMFLANNASWTINALYLIGLITAGLYGSLAMVISSVAMLSVNYLYQHGWFPSFLEKPYFFFCTTLMVVATFGMDSWIVLILTTANFIYFVYDYVQINIRGINSASSQFPIATEACQLSLENELGERLDADDKMENMRSLMGKLIGKSIRPTYNHFQQSSLLTNRLLGNKPKLMREELLTFKTLFDELDFNKKELRDVILNEMVSHDKFNQQSEQHLIADLELDPSVDPITIRIAYLKKEIQFMVERLSVYDYMGLTADRMEALYGHARLILEHLNTASNQEEKEAILLSLALRTGSQCTRAYLDEFSRLSHHYVITENQELTLSDRAVFAALELRTRRFSDYYFTVLPQIQSLFPSLFLFYTDRTEYHNFESFAISYGPYFHLRNTSLSIRVRDLSDFFNEKFYFYLLSIPEKCLFSDYYDEKALVQEVLKAGGDFGSLLMDWCNAIHPDLYQSVFLDEDYCFKNTADPDIQTLVRLMLVDLNIAEYTAPVHQVVHDPVVLQSTHRLSFFSAANTMQQDEPGYVLRRMG